MLDGVDLGWFEDIFPPGNAQVVADLRSSTKIPIAMGDEQGGIYYPEALIAKSAVDVIRIDLTCMGGITGGRRIVDECLKAGVSFAAHMFAHCSSSLGSKSVRAMMINTSLMSTRPSTMSRTHRL